MSSNINVLTIRSKLLVADLLGAAYFGQRSPNKTERHICNVFVGVVDRILRYKKYCKPAFDAVTKEMDADLRSALEHLLKNTTAEWREIVFEAAQTRALELAAERARQHRVARGARLAAGIRLFRQRFATTPVPVPVSEIVDDDGDYEEPTTQSRQARYRELNRKNSALNHPFRFALRPGKSEVTEEYEEFLKTGKAPKPAKSVVAKPADPQGELDFMANLASAASELQALVAAN